MSVQVTSEVQCLRIQQDQYKVLSYIYLDEFTPVKETAPYKFTILCRPFVQSQQFQYQISLQFQLPKTYPNTPLRYEIEPITGITRDNLQQITKKVEDIIYDNRDKPIVYQIVEEVRLWIYEYLIEGKADAQEQEIYAKKKVAEVFERPKFNAFTPVTVETFLAWKKKFDQLHAVKKQEKVSKKEPDTIKVSGKQWFLGKGQEAIVDSQEQESDEEGEGDEQDDEVEEKGPVETEYTENKLFVMDDQ